ncbi:MAG: hypothetical protein AAB839_00050 [Patescibacteria group bacterium]
MNIPVNPVPTRFQQFLDNWGHFLWVAPVAVLFTVITSHWEFITLFILVEFAQFFTHAFLKHPTHPMLRTLRRRLVSTTVFLILVALFLYCLTDERDVRRGAATVGVISLIAAQATYSETIHAAAHNIKAWLPALAEEPASLAIVLVLTVVGCCMFWVV